MGVDDGYSVGCIFRSSLEIVRMAQKKVGGGRRVLVSTGQRLGPQSLRASRSVPHPRVLGGVLFATHTGTPKLFPPPPLEISVWAQDKATPHRSQRRVPLYPRPPARPLTSVFVPLLLRSTDTVRLVTDDIHEG